MKLWVSSIFSVLSFNRGLLPYLNENANFVFKVADYQWLQWLFITAELVVSLYETKFPTCRPAKASIQLVWPKEKLYFY